MPCVYWVPWKFIFSLVILNITWFVVRYGYQAACSEAFRLEHLGPSRDVFKVLVERGRGPFRRGATE